MIVSAFALFAIGYVNAQEDKEVGKGFANGDLFMSGTVGFSSTKTGDFKSDSFTVAPGIGYFVSDNIAIGASLSYSSGSSFEELTGDGAYYEVDTNAFGIGAFARYYVTPASEFSFFGEFSVGYSTAKSEIKDFSGSEYTVNGFGARLAPGISYFISRNFALEATIGALSYISTKPDIDGAKSTNNFDLNLNLNDVNLGLIYKF